MEQVHVAFPILYDELLTTVPNLCFIACSFFYHFQIYSNSQQELQCHEIKTLNQRVKISILTQRVHCSFYPSTRTRTKTFISFRIRARL
jgi:hypothetical protein